MTWGVRVRVREGAVVLKVDKMHLIGLSSQNFSRRWNSSPW